MGNSVFIAVCWDGGDWAY